MPTQAADSHSASVGTGAVRQRGGIIPGSGRTLAKQRGFPSARSRSTESDLVNRHTYS